MLIILELLGCISKIGAIITFQVAQLRKIPAATLIKDSINDPLFV